MDDKMFNPDNIEFPEIIADPTLDEKLRIHGLILFKVITPDTKEDDPRD